MKEKELEKKTGQQRLIKNPNWGGRREGAGRRSLPPDGPRKKYSLYLSEGEHQAVAKVLADYRDRLTRKGNESPNKDKWVPRPFGQ